MKIKTNYWNTLEPDDIIHDNRGTLIKVGCDIAYNRSGEIMLGTILNLKKNKYKKQDN